MSTPEERLAIARRGLELYYKQMHEQNQRQQMEEEEQQRRASRAKKKYIERDREGGFEQLWRDYFADQPTYTDVIFRRRFRMRRSLFLRIVNTVEARDVYFQQRPDAIGRQSLHPLQKCTIAIRQLAYGCSADMFDEYLRIGESTGLECLKRFCTAVLAAFGDEYLRKPTSRDVERIVQMHEEKHGFPGMLGSIDCMHWSWKNCPAAWAGAYQNYKKGCPTIVLEAVASHDLWIWHAFYRVAGSNNDINVLNRSDVFSEQLRGVSPAVTFTANGSRYRMGYYLADGIYPKWATFVKTIPCPTDPARRLFAQKQEAARKDVERAFGVLQARWAIIRGPARLHYVENLREIMYACIIMHNMIVEDEGEQVENWVDDESAGSSSGGMEYNRGTNQTFERYLRRKAELRDVTRHQALERDMVAEIWNRFGHQE